MKGYQIYFILLKALIVIQTDLVFMKKMTNDSSIYILTDTIFKISIAGYLFLFFSINKFEGIEYEDEIILRFSGVILLWDIEYSKLFAVIRKHVPSFPKVPFLEYELIK